ncbi:MAG: polysaccharide deacetylase family protein, partial [Chloroflexi bacterium]
MGRLFARIAGFGPLDQRSAAGRRFRLPLRPRVGALQGPFRQRRSRCRDRRRRARYVVAYGCCRGAVGAEECGVEVGPEEPTRTVTRVTSRLTNQGVFRSGARRAGAGVRDPLILCYHAVSSTWPVPLATSEHALELHLSLLKQKGFVGLTFSDAERRRLAGTLPERSVVVTFDDGFLSTLRAKPLLDEVGFCATVFVVTEFVDLGKPLSWDGLRAGIDGRTDHAHELEPLGWDHLGALAESGWEVGSHTVTHPNLLHVDSERLERELRESRAVITRRVGACDTIAYPFGKADRRVADAAVDAGYVAGCTLDPVYRIDERYLRPR